MKISTTEPIRNITIPQTEIMKSKWNYLYEIYSTIFINFQYLLYTCHRSEVITSKSYDIGNFDELDIIH